MGTRCLFCGAEFVGKRADARYCSGSCRAKASQARHAPDAPSERGVATPTAVGTAVEPEQDRLIERMEAIERILTELSEDLAEVRERKPGRETVRTVDPDDQIARLRTSQLRQEQAIGELTAARREVETEVRQLEHALGNLIQMHAAMRREVALLAAAIAAALEARA